eukprot:g35137.t1
MPGKPPRPVRSVETGLVFPSVSAAARCMMLYGSQNIHQAMRNGTKAAGLHWEYVDPEEYKLQNSISTGLADVHASHARVGFTFVNSKKDSCS